MSDSGPGDDEVADSGLSGDEAADSGLSGDEAADSDSLGVDANLRKTSDIARVSGQGDEAAGSDDANADDATGGDDDVASNDDDVASNDDDVASEIPPRPGGSKLFPQLPDDPRLIEAQERERASAVAEQAAAEGSDEASGVGSAPKPPASGDPSTMTSAISSSELKSLFADDEDVALQSVSQSIHPTSAAPAGQPADASLGQWEELDVGTQWREGSQDYQAPITDDHTDDRSVHQAAAAATAAAAAAATAAADPAGSTQTAEPQRKGRNVPLAIGVGIMLAAIFFAALVTGRALVVMLVGLVLVLALAELYGVARTAGYRPATLFGLTSVAGLTGAVYWRGFEAYPIVVALTAIGGLIWFLIGVEHEHPTANFAITIGGIAWVGGLGSFAALILRTPNGDAVLVAAVIGTVTYDVLGYIVGSTTGQTRLSARISPNKTMEGLIGGIVLSVLVTSVVLYRFPGVFPFTTEVFDAVWLGVAVAVAAPLGDLCQSLIKRDMQVKDMGMLLPGHGGVLDRFDALLFALPAAYYASEYVLS